MVGFWVLLSNKECVFRRGLRRIERLMVVFFFVLIVQDVWPRLSTAWTSDSFVRVFVVIPILLILLLHIFFACIPERSALAGFSTDRTLDEDVPNICPLFILGDDFTMGECFRGNVCHHRLPGRVLFKALYFRGFLVFFRKFSRVAAKRLECHQMSSYGVHA